jgi:hypothetical protein
VLNAVATYANGSTATASITLNVGSERESSRGAPSAAAR